MKDFETHEIGTAEELRLSRQLADALLQVTYQYSRGILTKDVLNKLDNLVAHHKKMLEK